MNIRLVRTEGSAWKGWLLVCCLALGFLFYGLFMFVVVGDKGPPDWDFNTVEDIPGKSIYSTYPEPGEAPVSPEPQHVADKPALSPGEDEGENK